MKHMLLEIVEATEAAALAASHYVGAGDKNAADYAATNAMKEALNALDFSGRIAIGEGIKDNAPGLFTGELVGGTREIFSPTYDIALDPIDGTTQTAKGGYEAMSVITLAKRNCLLETESFYMNKIAVGKEIAEHLDPGLLKKPIEEVVELIKKVGRKKQITACMLDRPRNEELAKHLRSCGCRIRFIQDCDVSGAIAAALPVSGIDLYVGIGGAPEGVIAAAALKCLGGHFEGFLVDNKTYKKVDDKLYLHDDLAKGDVMFSATGITNGSLLKGVRHEKSYVITNSLLMESVTRSLKRVESYHGL